MKRLVHSILTAAIVTLSVVALTSPLFADEHCTTQEMLFRGKLALEPELILSPEDIHYQIIEKEGGKPNREWVVLIHGLGGSLHTWWEVAKDLAENDYRVLIYDQRGHGQTPSKGTNYSSSTMAWDLKGLLDKLGIRNAHMLGHSMGARTAMRFANLFPDRTLSVTSEDMHMIGRTKLLPDNLDYSQKLERLRAARFHSVWEAENFIYDLLGVEPDSEAFDHYELRPLDNGQFAFMNVKPQVPLYSSQGLQEDLTQALASAKMPVLFLAAENEPVLFGKGLDHVHATLPSAKVVVIPGSDHGVHDSAFSTYMKRFKAFLKSVR